MHVRDPFPGEVIPAPATPAPPPSTSSAEHPAVTPPIVQDIISRGQVVGHVTMLDGTSGDMKTMPFDLEIRHGAILENGKDTVLATIGNILDYMNKRSFAPSIVFGPGVDQYQLRDLVLHLPEFSAGDVCAAIQASSDSAVLSEEIRPGIFALRLHDTPERGIAVYNLNSYFNTADGKADDKTIQDKLAAVSDIIFKTLKDLDPTFGDATQPHYQFHKGAYLLVVTGTPQELDVANKVIGALTQTPDTNNNPFAAPDSQADLQNTANVAKAWAATNGYVLVTGEIQHQPALRIVLHSYEPLTVSQAVTMAGWTDFSKHIVNLLRWEKGPDGKEQLHTYKVDVDAVLLKNQKDKDMVLLDGDDIYVDWSLLANKPSASP